MDRLKDRLVKAAPHSAGLFVAEVYSGLLHMGWALETVLLVVAAYGLCL